MTRIFDTSQLTPQSRLNPDETSWVYNGLDCCVTLEVYEALMTELETEPQNVKDIYQFALDKSAPFLEMSLRGIRIDRAALESTIKELSAKLAGLESRFARLTREVFGHVINAGSHVQVKWLFYDYLGINPIKKRNSKGIYAPSSDEEAMNKLMFNFWAEPFARYVLAIRELRKKISFLKTELDDDFRFRTTLNIAGTNTGRASSSDSAFGTGSNLQNVDTTLRYPFVADPGMVLVNVDLEQADARNVGALIWNMFHGHPRAGDYLDACESGDTHTTVANMSWPDLAWPADRAEWKEFCDSLDVYPGISYRQAAKKIGHATNFFGKPKQIAIQIHIPQLVVEAFQPLYFGAFPLIKAWQDETIRQVREVGFITTPYGRRRHFFGRGDDPATWRKAIAYCPQSMTGHQIDSGILNLWRHMPEAQLLIQVHDSILFQVPYDRHEELVPRALELLRFPFELKGGRMFEVPLEAKTGYNWGNRIEDKKTGKVENEWGLAKWKGKEKRVPPTRTRSIKAMIG